MKVLLAVSHVPDTTSKIRFVNNDSEFDKTDIQYIISPFDELVLTRLLEIKEQTNNLDITVVTVGGADVEPTIRKALAIGADDAVRVDAEAVDALFVARQIAEVYKNGQFDFVMTGKESIDFTGNQVGEMVAEFLNLPSVASAANLELNGNVATITREIDGGKEVVEVQTPFVTSGQKGIAKEPRIPNMRGIMMARKKPLSVVPAVAQGVHTKVVKFSMPQSKGACKMIPADNPAELVRLLHEEAKVL
jgi:electron transfer flavoprotein beta subunit